jgi:CO/xanthine dehydrogenase FAD-binding subunit
MSYLRPGVLSEALANLAGGGHLVLAGGTDVYPAAVGRVVAGPLLDITGIGELSGIAHEEGALRIGATTTWAEIAGAGLPPAFDALKAAAAEVGGRQIQNAGTVGGNLCNASPAADGVPPLMVLDAEVELASTAGLRRMPLAAFLTGPRQTALRADEIMTAVLVPDAGQAGRSAFVKLGARRHLVISIAMVAARLDVADGVVRAAALAVGACGPVAIRLPAVEARLVGAAAGPGLARLIDPAEVATALAPIDDLRARADYRAEAGAELLRRAVAGLMA